MSIAVQPRLASDERKRLLHPRKGAEIHMQRVHERSVAHKLDVQGIPLQTMADDLAQELQPVADFMAASKRRRPRAAARPAPDLSRRPASHHRLHH